MAVDPNFVSDHYSREAQTFIERIATLQMRIDTTAAVLGRMEEGDADIRLGLATEVHTMERQKKVLEMMLEEVQARQKRLEDALK